VPFQRGLMDVNYSRWMSKDPDAEPDVVEDAPRRFRLRWPTRSAVASTAMVSLVVLGGGAFVRSIATPEGSADQVQTVETPAAELNPGPGAASVDDSTTDDQPAGDVVTDDPVDDSMDDSSTTMTRPAGPPPMGRRLVGPPGAMPPGPAPDERRLRALRHGDAPDIDDSDDSDADDSDDSD